MGWIVTALVALLLLWAPLPLGGVLPWSHTVLRLGAFAALAAAVLHRRSPAALRTAAVPVLALAAIGALGFVQAATWPAGLAGLVSPHHVEIAGAGGAPLSLAPAASRWAALTWLAVAAVLAAAAVAGTRRLARRWLGAALLAAAAFQVVYGARQWMAGAPDIFGLVGGSPERLRGTFVNPDHLALYLEIALAAVLAWGWFAATRVREGDTVERRLGLLVPPALAWLTLFAALAFTGSRAGLMAALLATGAQGLLLASADRRWRTAGVAAAVAAAGLVTVAAIGLQAGFGRWLGTSANELTWNGRLEAYRATLELWTRFPVLGSGLATFREAFPLVQPAGLAGGWHHTHNDWLEVLATTGVVGFAIVAAGLVVVAVRVVRLVRDPFARTEARAAGLAAAGALAAAALHSGLDFGLTMPANAATLAVVCGAALGASARRLS